jgi:photosystem II S4 domain protein
LIHRFRFAVFNSIADSKKTVLPRETLLKRATHRDTIARAIDLADQSLKTWEPAVSDFLSPPEIADIQTVFSGLAEVVFMPWGGYPQAERQRVAFARSELPLVTDAIEVAALEIAGNFLFDPATHRDFLGALLGTGLVRDKVGDLLVQGERGAQALVAPEVVEFLELSLTQVRSVPVKTRAIPLSELKVREPKKKEMTTVEASLRLDAIASAGFGLSRSKMAEAISGGDVRVNWKDITSPSHLLKSGDLVVLAGKGRLSIGEIATTKKDRYRVQLTRFV